MSYDEGIKRYVEMEKYNGTKWQIAHRSHYQWTTDESGRHNIVGYNKKYILKVVAIAVAVLAAIIALDIPFEKFVEWALIRITPSLNVKELPIIAPAYTIAINATGVIMYIMYAKAQKTWFNLTHTCWEVYTK